MKRPSPPLGLTALGVVCALGNDKATIAKHAWAGDTSGMRLMDGILPNGDQTPFGWVDLPKDFEPTLSTRCERLLAAAYAQIKDAFEDLKTRVPMDRIGIVLGTSNSAMEEYTTNPTHIDMALPATFLKRLTGIKGPSYVISTACSSSGKVFASARQLIVKGCCDAVLVGGVDAYTRLVVNGFYSLEALSTSLTRPFGADRTGINLGEGAALFILENRPAEVMLLGVGESSDAYHLTAPDPEGKGAEMALREALADAGLVPADVDYVNLHGTGTTYNDKMEARAVVEVFGDRIACSSTKPMTGHALGAAGAIEAALCWLMLQAKGPAFPHVLSGERDMTLPSLPLVEKPTLRYPKRVISTSFAFGGSNVAVLLGRGDASRHYAMEELLAHRAPLILIDDYDAASFSDAGLTTEVTIREGDVFFDVTLGGTPPCTALEYMAQSVAAYVGLRAVLNGKAPMLGFVLGSRALTLNLSVFAVGERYTIRVEPQFSDDQFAAFETKIYDAKQVCVASAMLNVFRPDEAEAKALLSL
ncbi:MAG: beta-ketoacyl synthase N-terminal-like domain-containing protein [bacterium]|nr:beta-ketoacyl synthase N-terminal-like domain-containing protein [bacterium]